MGRDCHPTTSGNPLRLYQMVRALEVEGLCPDASHADLAVALGSRAVSSMVLIRLRRCSEDVVAVARSAAALGDGAAVPAVAAMDVKIALSATNADRPRSVAANVRRQLPAGDRRQVSPYIERYVRASARDLEVRPL